MEISMVKCPNCGTVYNAAMNTGCPGCAGGNQPGGFSKTVAPDSAGFGGQQAGGFAPTMAPGTFAKTNAFVTTPPIGGDFGGGNNTVGVTAPPKKDGGNFGVTTYVGDDAHRKEKMRAMGWIVAIDGPNAGKDYRLHASYNYIGKNTGDVRIEGDPSISREKDSFILCDTQTGSFYLAHLQGANPVRINGEPVVSGSGKLKAYDIITIGSTRLVFVPLCGENFSWEDAE